MFEDVVEALRDARAYLRWIQRMGLRLPQAELAARVARLGGGSLENAVPPLLFAKPRKPAGGRPTAPSGSGVQPEANHGREAHATGSKGERLERIAATVRACRKCPLGHMRQNAVPGSGNPDADLMFIGEAPGATEDKTGLPFVGAAGKLLEQELEKNGIRRNEVFIANVIKCRPPENRDPQPEEIEACQPYLREQIRVIQPKMLCALGRYAAGVLVGHPIGIMKIRGTWESFEQLPLFICLHPSAALRYPGNRKLFDADIASLAKDYHETRSK